MQNSLVAPRTLAGFMELMPNEQIVLDNMKDVLESEARLNSFVCVETPILESSEVLLAKAGGETEKQVYRFSRADNDMCMRFDNTVPLAKYVAMHSGELVFPFRRYALGKVYRGERAQKGRFREFYQFDLDIIGDGELSLESDAEMIYMLSSLYKKLNIGKVTIKVNNRKILNAMLDYYGLSDNGADCLRILDKIDKVGKQEVLNMLVNVGVKNEIANSIIEFVEIKGEYLEMCDKICLVINSPEMQSATNELKYVLSTAIQMGLCEQDFVFDLKTVRGLDYYTATVFEASLDAHPEFGSVGGGGRYENLAGYYTKRILPGVGFAIGLTRLFSILKDNNMISFAKNTNARALILPLGDTNSACFEIAKQLKSAGIACEVSYNSKSFKSKLNTANRLGVDYVIIVGEDEVNNKCFALKDMQTGMQENLTLAEIIKKLA